MKTEGVMGADEVTGSYLDTDEVFHCWLVWKRANDDGRPYLVAVDTTEARANLHVEMVKREAEVLHSLSPRELQGYVQVEPSFLNHAYGETMGQGYDRLKKLMQETRRSLVYELQTAREGETAALALVAELNDALINAGEALDACIGREAHEDQQSYLHPMRASRTIVACARATQKKTAEILSRPDVAALRKSK